MERVDRMEVGEYVGAHLSEIVSDYKDDVIRILERKGWTVTKTGGCGRARKTRTGRAIRNIVQFKNLSKCEIEAEGRHPSGRRRCKFYDVPCGVKNPAKCAVLKRWKKRVQANEQGR